MAWGSIHVAVACLSMVAWGAPAWSWQEPIADQAVALVADLAHDDWQVRTHATAALIGITRELPGDRALQTLENALKQWMDSRDLDAGPGDFTEVLARFETAAIEAFFMAPRSGLGVNYDPNQSDRGVTLGGTLEPFDAHGKLRAGDVIIEISGMPIERGLIDLPVAIASHLPGEEALIVLDRGGERLRIPVRIGRREDLRTVQSPEQSLLRRAWAVRASRLLGRAMLETLDAGDARLIHEAPVGPDQRRGRITFADVTPGGEPNRGSARQVGVVTTYRLNPNDSNAALREELERISREMALVNRRNLELNNTLAQIDLELTVTPDNEAGRARAEALRKRRGELALEIGDNGKALEALRRQRVAIIQALNQ